jgi:processive 1,2-diacylglycerol beta-glucosyltransferase
MARDAGKKIVILYASAGHGHEKAARAVEERCRRDGHEVQCLDVLPMTPKAFGENYRAGYLRIISQAPRLWGFLYYLADFAPLHALLRPLRRVTNHLMARPLERMLLENPPDGVVSTHFLATEVVGNMKRKGRLRSKLVTVITDYKPHYFWLEQGVDAYAVASDETREELLRRRIPAERIEVTGIPVMSKFEYPLDKAVQRGFLRLATDDFVVLLTSGGAGVGTTAGLVKSLLALDKKVVVLAVCGTNEALRAELSALGQGRLKVYGFVNNMDELMAAADVVIGKGGGLTMTECFAMHAPMIVLKPVPGQESRNAQVAQSRGAAILARDASDVVAIVRSVLLDPQKLARVRQGAASMARPAAAARVVALAVGHAR